MHWEIQHYFASKWRTSYEPVLNFKSIICAIGFCLSLNAKNKTRTCNDTWGYQETGQRNIKRLTSLSSKSGFANGQLSHLQLYLCPSCCENPVKMPKRKLQWWLFFIWDACNNPFHVLIWKKGSKNNWGHFLLFEMIYLSKQNCNHTNCTQYKTDCTTEEAAFPDIKSLDTPFQPLSSSYTSCFCTVLVPGIFLQKTVWIPQESPWHWHLAVS